MKLIFSILVLSSLAAPALARPFVQPSHLRFGRVPVGSQKTLTLRLRNDNQTELRNIRTSVSGQCRRDFSVHQGRNCRFNLRRNGSCVIDVTFSPDRVGNRNCSLTVRAIQGVLNTRDFRRNISIFGTGQ